MLSFLLSRCAPSLGLALLLAVPALADNADVPSAPAGIGAPSRLDEAETAALINRLGDASFDSREAAARRLKEIGLPALAALREASSHRNLEVRYRVRRLLVDVEQLDHERRLAVFE